MAGLRVTRNRAIVLGGIVTLLALAAIVVVVVSVNGSGDPPAEVHVPPLSAERAALIAADVSSGDPVRVADAVAAPPGRALPADALTGLALTIDVMTFVAGPDGTGTVSGSLTRPDQPAALVTVYLVYVDGQWRLADMEGTV